MVQWITAGEFVDFMDLPPAKSRLPAFRDNQASTLAILQLQEVEKQRKLIPDYSTWSQCFAVFAAVLGSDQPQRLPELMSYQHEMASLARKYKWPAWVAYDMNYR